MAQKMRHRIWYYPVFEKELEKLRADRTIGSEDDDEWPILFDRKEDAYSLAYANRFEVIRENGEVVTNEQGHAQLKSNGRIWVIGIKGKMLDWNRVVKMMPSEIMKGDAVAIPYELPLHKQFVAGIFPEKEELFEQAMTSPIAKAGGITYVKPVQTDEPAGQEDLVTAE